MSSRGDAGVDPDDSLLVIHQGGVLPALFDQRIRSIHHEIAICEDEYREGWHHYSVACVTKPPPRTR